MISTNAGQSMTKQKANLPKWVKYDLSRKESLTFSVYCSKHDQTHRVMFDSDREAAFLVHTPERVIKFIMSPEGLFYHAPNYCTATQLRQTVWEDESFYSHLQKE